MTDTSADAETAVRRYLTAVQDPDALIDHERIAELETAVSSATDPIDKLRAMAELQRARAVDVGAIRQGFVRHARAWAARNGIPADAFRQLGVPEDAIAAAGLVLDQGRRARPRKVEARSGGAVTVETISAHIRAMRQPFTFADIALAAGGSPMTIRKALADCVREGIIDKSVARDWAGPGRAPHIFAPVRLRS